MASLSSLACYIPSNETTEERQKRAQESVLAIQAVAQKRATLEQVEIAQKAEDITECIHKTRTNLRDEADRLEAKARELRREAIFIY